MFFDDIRVEKIQEVDLRDGGSVSVFLSNQVDGLTGPAIRTMMFPAEMTVGAFEKGMIENNLVDLRRM